MTDSRQFAPRSASARSGLTACVAAFATARDLDLPSAVIEKAKLSIFDWFAVLNAGAAEPVSDIVRAAMAQEQTRGASKAAGMLAPLSARAAAYVNGTISHALDYDDTHFGMVGHPTVAVLPAVLAIVQDRRLGGQDLIEAFVIGVETACRLGSEFGRSHYAAGFHQTATSGTFGAAASVSRLLDLDVLQTCHALGFAATRASGLRSQFGTMGKPIHAGMAASNGVEAGRLAALGGVSRPDAIECVEGFAETHASGGMGGPTRFAANAPFEFPAVQYKFHACCHGTHGPLEAALSAKQHLQGGPEAIARITVNVNPQWANICCIPRPSTGLEVKFSLSTVIALALLGANTAAPATFTDALCSDPSVTALADKVAIEFVPSIPDTQTILSIETAGSEPIRATHDLLEPIARGVASDRLQRKAAALLGPDRADAVWRFVNALNGLGPDRLSRDLNEFL